MKIVDKLKVKGHVKMKVLDEDGNEKDLWQENTFGRLLFDQFGLDLRVPFLTGRKTTEYHKDNLVVNAGLAGIASRINGAGGEAAFTYIAVGTDSTAAASGDTTLGAEITDSGLSRASATTSRETQNVTNDKAKLVNSFSVTASKSVSEVGIFNAASAGTMLSRMVITTKNVTNGDTLQVTYTLYSS